MRRMTDTEKWGDPWYRKLPVEYKKFWDYICDMCDNAGVWKADGEAADFHVGTKIDLDKAFELFTQKRIWVFNGKEKWYIRKFISFQCNVNQLSMNCKPHAKIVEILERHGISERVLSKNHTLLDTVSSTLHSRDKEKERDKEKDKEKERGTIYPEDFERFWKIYPKKTKKKKALESWKKIKPNNELIDRIIETVEKFKKTKDWIKDDGEFIPMAVTWLNQERWEDEIEKPQVKDPSIKCPGCGKMVHSLIESTGECIDCN